eukprot:CAMPEP_0170108796 /NCGR_PEP_ID=MMETSP0020_2-20130122/6793_1 /TAXON_ID=98059 /ORGANISM="Dinobryon sp., Strain UTEXLB2267" /LENGTH=42 /DNA_ID= /DNA_START= /DNA_END= /DNA_ORIENTATION=
MVEDIAFNGEADGKWRAAWSLIDKLGLLVVKGNVELEVVEEH